MLDFFSRQKKRVKSFYLYHAFDLDTDLLSSTKLSFSFLFLCKIAFPHFLKNVGGVHNLKKLKCYDSNIPQWVGKYN